MIASGGDADGWRRVINFHDYGHLLPVVRNSLIAGAVVALVGGLIGPFVVSRDLPFAVHGISELSFAGASGALLIGSNVVAGAIVGSLVAALLLGLLGDRAQQRNSVIGVVMPFGLGLGVLFLGLYRGRAANKFGLLTGQIVAVDTPRMRWLIAVCAVVIVALALMWRPLAFSGIDPDVAAARGVPTRVLSVLFLLTLGLAVATAVQIVGALLVLALLVTPAAAAMQVTAAPAVVTMLSVIFAVLATVGGILLATGSTLPISPYVTTISFTIFLACRALGAQRARRGWVSR
ncbi:MAG TPA: metal ABC transporter permease [Sporichthyaceae bacterium]